MRSLASLLAALTFCFSEYAFSASNEKSCLPPEGAQPFEFAAGDNHLRGFIDVPKRYLRTMRTWLKKRVGS